jgi:septation ring formation regulator EzrA
MEKGITSKNTNNKIKNIEKNISKIMRSASKTFSNEFYYIKCITLFKIIIETCENGVE